MHTQTQTSRRQPTTSGDRATGPVDRASTVWRLLAEAWEALPAAGRFAAVGAATASLLTGFVSAVPFTAALMVAAAVPAAVVDLHVRRLPDPLVAVAALVGLVTLVVEAVAGVPAALGAIALGAVAMGGPILALHLASPRSMGFGDVKLAIVLGAALGTLHWQLALSGLALAAGLTALVALLGRRTTIAFGPGLLVGALLALLAHPVLLPTESEHVDSGTRTPAPFARDADTGDDR
jgi:leader peptidase (prepilin peptidase)/N-methyltransferase